jgi:hypothetical protein
MSNLWSTLESTINNANSITSPLLGGAINTQGAASSYSTNTNAASNVAATNSIQFTPSSTAPFAFQVTLDGAKYSVIVTWNIYAQRYYVNIYTTGNVLIVSLPLIGSPLNYNISLTAGYFTTQLIYRAPTQQFQVIG